MCVCVCVGHLLTLVPISGAQGDEKQMLLEKQERKNERESERESERERERERARAR